VGRAKPKRRSDLDNERTLLFLLTPLRNLTAARLQALGEIIVEFLAR